MPNTSTAGCRLCGSPSYRRLSVAGSRDGELILFQCSGCSAVFADPAAWSGQEEPPVLPVIAAPAVHLHVAPPSPLPPNLSSYGAGSSQPLLPDRG